MQNPAWPGMAAAPEDNVGRGMRYLRMTSLSISLAPQETMNTFPATRLLATACLALAGAGVHAQDAANFPNKTLTFVVPYAPGGSSDTRARMLAAKMTKILGQTI